ncbi:hypothetical protein [Pedobacter sp.]
MLRSILMAVLMLGALVQVRAQELGSNVVQNPTIGDAVSSFFNTPKALSKGQVSKSYPLFTKNMNAFTYNLSFDYDGGNGLKIYNPGSIIGKGWKMDVGGMIVREKRGRADEDHFNYGGYRDPETGNLINNHDYTGSLFLKSTQEFQLPDNQVYLFDINGNDTLSNIYFNYIDNAKDVFSFNYMGRSGKFVLFNQDGVIKAQTFPTLNIKINVYFDYELNKDTLAFSGKQTPTIGAFTITDEYANTYFFEKADITYESLSDGQTVKDNPEIDAWQLKMIIPQYPVVGEERKFRNAIVFDYYKINLKEVIPSLGTGMKYPVITKLPQRYNYFVEYYGERDFSASTIISTPKSITFPDSTFIKFNYEYEFTSGKNQGQQIGLLKDVEIFKNHNILTKRYDFKYYSPKLNNGNLKYESLVYNQNSYISPRQFYKWYLKSFDDNGKQVNGFEYYHDNIANEEIMIADPNKVMKSADHFGYPNGDMNNFPTTLSNLPLDNRLPNSTFTHMGMLKKVNYRNGGYEHFIYEPNQRDSLGSTMTIGGIRIKRHSIIDPTNSMNNKVIEYSYKNTSDTTKSSGFFGNTPKLVKYFHNYQSAYPAPINTDYYIVNGLGHNSISANLIGYNAVKEKQFQFNGSGYELYKSIQYTYTGVDDIHNDFKPTHYDYPVDIYMDMPLWVVGHVKNIIEYNKYNKIIREQIKEYEISQFLDSRSLKVDVYGLSHAWIPYEGVYNISKKYIVQNFYTAKGYVNLISNTIREYDLNSPVTKYTSKSELYEYNVYNQLYAKIICENDCMGMGSYKSTYYYYYLDDYNLPTLIEKHKYFKEGTNNNYTRRLLEAKAYEYVKSPLVLSHTDYNYLSEDATLPLSRFRLSKIYNSKLTGPMMESIPAYNKTLNVQPGRGLELVGEKNINSYGNLSTEVDEFGVKTHYLYDKYQQLIATFNNGEYDQFKYFSFEENERNTDFDETGYDGNDMFNNTHLNLQGSNVITNSDAISGKNVVGNDFRIYMPVGRYHIKVWAKGNGSLIVYNGNSANLDPSWQEGEIPSNLSADWKLYDFEVEITSTFNSIMFLLSNARVDNLMIFPENGSITATAYLYNTSSLSDYFLRTYNTAPNGMISINDFDQEGRPIGTRDYKKNIRESKVYVGPQ